MMSQDDFAEHVEVGLDDIAEPDAADVLEMAQTFHAKSQSTFRQATRLASARRSFSTTRRSRRAPARPERSRSRRC